MNTDKNTNNGSASTITFGRLLQLTFIVLKLCAGIVILVVIGALIAGVIPGLIHKARRKG